MVDTTHLRYVRFIAKVINDDNLITSDDCIRYYRNEDTFCLAESWI